jgi:hypothetical protein
MPDFAKVHQNTRTAASNSSGSAGADVGQGQVVAFVSKLDVKFPIWMDSNIYHWAHSRWVRAFPPRRSSMRKAASLPASRGRS